MKKNYSALILILVLVSFSIILFSTSKPIETNQNYSHQDTTSSISSSNVTSNLGSVKLYDCELLRIVDGDTIEVTYNTKKEKVRMIGIDTPESVHPDENKNTEFGKLSSDFTKKYLENKKIQLEFDVEERDKYGRLLAYVYVDGVMFNKTLLEEGYAQIATYPPNVKYVEDFKEIQKIARDNNKGLWSYSDAQSTSQSSNIEFVASKNSTKFHYSTCEWAMKISENNKITFSSFDEAIDNNYEPCKVCNPK